MKWRVRLMRNAGRRIPWNIVINQPGLTGTVRTQACTHPVFGSYRIAVLVGNSAIAPPLQLIEPQLLMLGDQALILRGYERLRDDEGSFTVLQEWRCEPA
jgi:hypothetical protein